MISIYSMDGRQVHSKLLNDDQLSIGRYQFDYRSLGLQAGTYVVRINTANELISARFVVTK